MAAKAENVSKLGRTSSQAVFLSQSRLARSFDRQSTATAIKRRETIY